MYVDEASIDNDYLVILYVYSQSQKSDYCIVGRLGRSPLLLSSLKKKKKGLDNNKFLIASIRRYLAEIAVFPPRF